MNQLIIPTEREGITLRQLTIEDAPAYFEAVDANREHLSQFGDETSANYPTLASVEASIEHPRNPDKIRMGIWDGDQFVGTANLTPAIDGDSTELGYWTDGRQLRKGYATLAAKALATYGFERFGRVFAVVSTEQDEEGKEYTNSKSVGVLEKAGFAQIAKESGKLIFELYGQQDDETSFAERVKDSAIHTWAEELGIEIAPGKKLHGMDAFLEFIQKQTGTPRTLFRPFHEIMIARGKYSADITDEDAKAFGKEARNITERFELTPLEARWLMEMLYLPVQGQWIKSTRSDK